MQFQTKHMLLYAITNRAQTDAQTFLNQTENALKGGITMLQLREKGLDEASFVTEAIQIKQLCRKYHVPLIINDNVNVALKSGADGVHVGADDEPVKSIRQRAGKNFIIGATAKTIEQAKKAQADGADYLGVGAVFPSPTKQNAIRITPQLLFHICSCVTIPAVAIGGVSHSNVMQLKGCGMSGIAVSSAVFVADNITASTIELKKQVEQLMQTKGGIQ